MVKYFFSDPAITLGAWIKPRPKPDFLGLAASKLREFLVFIPSWAILHCMKRQDVETIISSDYLYKQMPMFSVGIRYISFVSFKKIFDLVCF